MCMNKKSTLVAKLEAVLHIMHTECIGNHQARALHNLMKVNNYSLKEIWNTKQKFAV